MLKWLLLIAVIFPIGTASTNSHNLENFFQQLVGQWKGEGFSGIKKIKESRIQFSFGKIISGYQEVIQHGYHLYSAPEIISNYCQLWSNIEAPALRAERFFYQNQHLYRNSPPPRRRRD